MRQEVQTIDEGVHLTAGVSYWLTGDYRLNEEHPPLVKLLAALPVLLAKPNINFSSPSWENGDQWAFAREFLYEQGNDADRLLFLGRLPMLLVSAGLGLVLFLWARRLGGDLAGLFTLGWFALDPNFLAHGRYITTDVAVALGYAATLLLLVRLLEQWRWQRLLAFGVTFGVTQVTKFSALFLWLLILIIPGLWYARAGNFRTLVRRTLAILGIALLGTFVSVMGTYAGQVRQGRTDPWVQALYRERENVLTEGRLTSQPMPVQRAIRWSDPNTATGRAIRQLTLDTPIPGWSYFKGIALVLNHDYWGHLSYLKGMYGTSGWWWYFPLAFVVKTPFATLILFCLSLIALAHTWGRNQRRARAGLFVLLGAAGVYFLWSFTSHINLGLRHIFPVYPAVFVAVGLFVAATLASKNVWLKWSVVGISALYVLSSALAFPAYTAYFSELVGGSANGPRYLVDSNIDWGQDVKRLSAYLKEHEVPFVCMSYFGQASLVYYGLDHRYLPAESDPHEPTDVNCVVAISITSLLSEDRAYAWLRAYQPDARIGGSIDVYDFRNGRVPAKNPN